MADQKRSSTEVEMKHGRSGHSSKYSGKRELHTFRVGNSKFTVDRRYDPVMPLGKGAYGVVVACRDKLSDTLVAVKKVQNIFENMVRLQLFWCIASSLCKAVADCGYHLHM